MTVSAIVAMGERNRVIGRDNDLPWSVRLKPDMNRFKVLTTGHAVIMGRRTFESIPLRFRPLPDRTNIVVTSKILPEIPDTYGADSVEAAIRFAKDIPGGDEVFIIGGAGIYKAALPFTDRIYLTLVDEDAEGDTFFPELSEFRVVESEVVLDFTPRLTFQTLERM